MPDVLVLREGRVGHYQIVLRMMLCLSEVIAKQTDMIQLGKLLLILWHQLVAIYYHVRLHPVDGIDDSSSSCTWLKNLAVGTEVACQRYQPVGNLGWHRSRS